MKDGHALPTDPFDPAGPALSVNVPLLIGTNLTEVTFNSVTPLDPIDEKGAARSGQEQYRPG